MRGRVRIARWLNTRATTHCSARGLEADPLVDFVLCIHQLHQRGEVLPLPHVQLGREEIQQDTNLSPAGEWCASSHMTVT